MQDSENKRVAVSFAALDPYIESNIVSPKETAIGGKEYVQWGDRNQYPEYLLSLYKGSPTLRSIIIGTRDMVLGNDLTALPLAGRGDGIVNRNGETAREVAFGAAEDLLVYGGFALQVIRSKDGRVAEVYSLPMRYIRSNKENSVFYYSEEWSKSRQKVIIYPAFVPGLEDKWLELDDKARAAASSSILFVSNDRTQVYPFPVYGAAVKACETERCIADFHLNSICNGFVASAMVNFNNGVPTDDIKEEIERTFNEKFAGSPNAGRIVFSWNASRQNATTIDYPKVDDFGAKYQALEKSSARQIFTAFRATPVLFGIPTDNNGFAADDYENAFRLYNRTAIQPMQRVITEAFEKVWGVPGALTIVPFTLDGVQPQTIN